MHKRLSLIRRNFSKAQACVATIGNFDGLHLGHQKIIQEVVLKARQLSLIPTVITFEPLPQDVLPTKNPFTRLMRISQKLSMLASLGIEQVVCLRFSEAFALLSPTQFIEQYLVKLIDVRYLLIGEGFRFGFQQTGTVQTLIGKAAEFGYEVHAIAHEHNDDKISSSKIRHALKTGNLMLAQQLLGRHFSIDSRVVKGAQRGSLIGFPTANLAYHPACELIKGVFVTYVHIQGKKYQAVANSGKRPTVDGTKHVTEVHLLDYDGNLYNQKINVEFLHKLRDEIRFDSIEQLKQQITQDVKDARDFFKKI
ncbi:MAG: bifunctional riboflavin kinase/FAD synthetase [Proteobacteria bacterium]|nr:bifunctional riboflavin kinase/FAD synthetase [Pseudomonadota bacterium]